MTDEIKIKALRRYLCLISGIEDDSLYIQSFEQRKEGMYVQYTLNNSDEQMSVLISWWFIATN